MQIETTMAYHHIPTRMTKIKTNQRILVCGKKQNSQTLMKSLVVSWKAKQVLLYNLGILLTGIYPRKSECIYPCRTVTQMCI